MSAGTIHQSVRMCVEAQLSALMQSILASRVSKFQTAAQKTELKSSLAGLVDSKLYLWNFFLVERRQSCSYGICSF